MPPVVNKQSPTTKGTTRTSRSSSVIDRITPIQFDQDEGIKMLLYGESGTGKTTFWATFPGPILSIVCSGGNRAGELRSLNDEARKKVRTVTLQSSSEMKELVEHAEGGGYKTIVLDHASGLQDLVLKELLGLDELPGGVALLGGAGHLRDGVVGEEVGAPRIEHLRVHDDTRRGVRQPLTGSDPGADEDDLLVA